MFGLQPIHIAIIVVLAILIFGPKKLPEIGRSLGKGIREFKQSTHEISEEFKDGLDSEAVEPKAAAAPKEQG